MLRQCIHIAEYDELHACPCDGNIHAAEVAEEAYLSLIIASHERENDDIALLSLESINGIHRDEMAIGLEELALLYHTAQQLHLSTIGRDDAYVYLLIENALLSDA